MDSLDALRAMKAARDAGDIDGERAALKAYTEIAKATLPYERGPVDMARAAAGGALYSAADELEAGVRAPFSEQGYPEILKGIRSTNNRYEMANPLESGALAIGGGMVTGGAEYSAMNKIPTIARMTRVPQLITIGGLGGAASGIGAGTDLVTRGVGGLLGGLAGSVGGYIGSKLEGFYKGTGQQHAAERELTRQNIPAEVAKLNEGQDIHWATGVDVEPMLAKTARDARPSNRESFDRRYKDRNRLQFPLLESSLKGLGDSPQSRAEALSALMQSRRESARRLYAPMEGETVTRTPALMATMKTKQGQDAAERTLDALRELQENPGLTLETAADTFDFWHGFQQVLRDKAEGLGVADRLSKLEATAVDAKRDRVMASMFGEKWGERYKEATAQYRSDSEVIDALKDSEKFIKLDRGVFQSAVDKMNEEQRSAFASGVISDLVEKAARSPDTANMARNITKTPAMRHKLEALLGPDRYEQVEKQLNGLATMTETYGTLYTNSNTAEKLATKEIILGGNPDASTFSHLMSGNVGHAIRNMVTPRAATVLHPRTAHGILDVLGTQSPEEFAAAMDALRRSSRPSKATVPVFLGGVRGGITQRFD